MKTCMTVKINAGKRTPPEVVVALRSVNAKTLTMPNGATVTEDAIAQWIVKNLEAALNTLPCPNAAGEVRRNAVTSTGLLGKEVDRAH
jgi:hypothetical protein